MRCLRSNSLKRRGFTLVEVVMSLLILAILLAAAEATLVASMKAIPDPKNLNAAINAGASATSRFRSELACALSVTEMGANAITFTVPDRNGDGNPETIRYAWSGVAGDPLTRQYNGGSIGVVVPSINSFQLQYDKTSQAYYTTSEGAEQVVYSFTNTLLPQDVALTSTSYPGEYFVPSLPNGTVSWRVSRVMLRVHDNSTPDGQASLQLRTATPGGLPTNRVLDQATMLESTFGSTAVWATYSFSHHSGLAPGSGYCVTVVYSSGSSDCGYVQKNTLSLLSSSTYLKSTNSGSTWTTSGLDSLLIYVYGVPTFQNAASYNYYLQNVRVSLATTSDTHSAVPASIRLLNAPQVTGP